METISFKENKEFMQFIRNSIHKKKLIPVIGAGFTCGLNSKKGTVPSGKELQDLMIESICRNNNEISFNELIESNFKFSEIADFYFKYTPKQEYKTLLKNRFTNVSLTESRQKFLDIHWPFIFTLNIDDAIESNSKYSTILPYKKVSKNLNEINCIYKMHGDVQEEIKYEDIPNIIFSSDQYIKALEGNSSILEIFQNEFTDNNMLFIGCSLNDEVDLNYAIKTVKENKNTSTKKIYVTTESISPIRKSKLEMFGIDVILTIPSYDYFYDEIHKLFIDIVVTDDDKYQEFKNKNITILQKERSENKEFLTDIIGSKSSEKKLPYYHTKRNLMTDILSEYENQTFTVISGKRFSGKTFLARQLSSVIKNKDIYFFPSSVSLSKHDLLELSHIKNSVFIFDTNTITYESAIYLEDLEDKIKESSSNFILFIHKSDSLLSSVVDRFTPEGINEINNKLNTQETTNLNGKLDELGILKSIQTLSLMDNCFRFCEEFKDKSNKYDILLSDNDILLLMLLATESKIYSIILRLFGLNKKDIDSFINKLSPFVEYSTARDLEFFQHSGYKIILNSPSWAFKILGMHYERNGVKEIATQATRIVKTLHKKSQYESIYKRMIGFDNLNQIFPTSNKGAANIIFELYHSFESILFSDPHFWLQRAKSILILKRNDIPMIELAIDYAKKSYHDTENFKLKINSTTTLAMLYGRLARETKYNVLFAVESAIEWYYESLQDRFVNKRYINGIINKDKDKNDLTSLVKYLVHCKEKTFNNQILSKIDYITNIAFTHREITERKSYN